MPNISVLKDSKFLKQDDVEPPVLVTIDRLDQQNVAKEGAEPEMKWVIHFKELDKPLVLNSTNGQLIAGITGSPETDDWPGHRVVLYKDPSVSFGGQLVGGIRCRKPRAAAPAAPAAKPAPAPAAEPMDETPF